MKKIILIILALLPTTYLTTWNTVNAQNPKSKSSEKGFFTMGIHHTMDFYKSAVGIGLGTMANFGRYSDLLNVSTGLEYIEYLGGDPRPEDSKNGLGVVDGGGQLVIPAYLKLNIIRTSKWTKFYLGCGVEAGFKIRDGGVLKHYYEEGKVLRDHSFAITPILGWKSRNLDFGLFYKHYIDKPFYNSLDGKKNFGEVDARIGYHFTYYF